MIFIDHEADVRNFLLDRGAPPARVAEALTFWRELLARAPGIGFPDAVRCCDQTVQMRWLGSDSMATAWFEPDGSCGWAIAEKSVQRSESCTSFVSLLEADGGRIVETVARLSDQRGRAAG